QRVVLHYVILRGAPLRRASFAASALSESSVPSHARRVDVACGDAPSDEAIEVCDALAGRHAQHLHAHAAAKQRAEYIDRPLRLGKLLAYAGEAFLVPLDERIEARVQSVEGFVVRGQDQDVVG